MSVQPQFEKDVAALRSQVIDGIEEVNNTAESTMQAVWYLATLQKWTLVAVWVIAILLATHVIHHW